MQQEDLQKPEPPISEEAHVSLRVMDEHLTQTWKQLIEVEAKLRRIKKQVLMLVYRVSPLDTFEQNHNPQLRRTDAQ
jgi:hypothetical protein